MSEEKKLSEGGARPALSASEWRECIAALGGEYHRSPMIAAVANVALRADSPPQVARPQALAALCLYGQPFGFTHEDVETLRNVRSVFSWHDYGEEDGVVEDWDEEALTRIASIANRIAALLPPDTP